MMAEPRDTSLDAGFAELARPNVRGLAPYQPGKPVAELERELGVEGAIKLASNENPLGPSPRALEAAQAALAEAASYPDAGHTALRAALAAHHGVSTGEIFPAAGADEIIHLLVRTYCRPGIDEVVTPRHGFISYRLASQVHEAVFRETDLHDDLTPDVDALIAAASPRTRLVFVGQPNNPTGAHVSRGDLERLLAALPAHAIVVLDEAYHEFAHALVDDMPDGIALQQRGARPTMIVLRTFSKAYGLAGLRVGYAVAAPGIVGFLDRVRQPFNVSAVAQAAAIAALGDAGHVARTIEMTRAGLAELARALDGLGVRRFPTAANFVLVDVGRDALPVYQALLERGVIVRPLAMWGLPRHLRITIGTVEQCARVVAALRDALA